MDRQVGIIIAGITGNLGTDPRRKSYFFVGGGEFDLGNDQSLVLPTELVYFPDMGGMRDARAGFCYHRILAKLEHFPGILDGYRILELGTADTLDGPLHREKGFLPGDANPDGDSISTG
jgi:hypothetical protein